MKMLTVPTTFLSAFLAIVPATTALAQTSGTERLATVSACGSTLSDMEQTVQAKMESMGGSRYVITSARMGNRTTGTAIIYK